MSFFEDILLPIQQEVPRLDLFATQQVEGFITGMHKSPYHGFSVEFAQHRSYNPGDNLRDVDWKLYGKTDRLFVKEFEEETNLRAQIILDISSSMHYKGDAPVSKLQFSVLVAASLIELCSRQRDAVGLHFMANGIQESYPAKTSRRHRQELYAELEKAWKDDKTYETNISETIDELQELLPKRSLLILISDFMQEGASPAELANRLAELKQRKHEIIVFDISEAAKEMDFTFDNRPHKFIDMETGESLKLTPGQLQEAYTKAIQSWKQEIKESCFDHHIDYNLVSINDGIEPVLLEFLLKRQKLH